MGGMPFAGIPPRGEMGGSGFPEGSGRFSSARRPARLSTLRQAGRMRMPRGHPVEGDGRTCRHLEAYRPGTLHLGAPDRVGRRRSRRIHRRQPSGHRRLLRLPYRIYAPRRINSRLEAAAFAARAINAEDVSWEHGLPLTRPERTLIDLCLDNEDPSLIADAYRDARDIGLDYEHLGKLVRETSATPKREKALEALAELMRAIPKGDR